MIDVQQDTSAQSSNTAAKMEERDNEHAPGASGSQLSTDRERCQSQLDTLHYQRQTTVEGLQKLEEAIEKATLAVNAADSTKLTSLHAKRRSFEQRLEELASQEEILTRHLEVIAEKERVSSIELHLAARRNAHHEGVAIADKLRSGLRVVEGLYQQWAQWSETDRRLKDILRSAAPDTMTVIPDYSYSTAMDGNFQQAISQVLTELHRSESALRSRAAERATA